MSTTTLDQIAEEKRIVNRLTRPVEALLGLVALIALIALASGTVRPIHVTVDGVEETVFTHRRTLDRLLLDLGFALDAVDRVTPAPATPLRRNMTVTIERPLPVQLFADGRDMTLETWGDTPATVLGEAGVTFHRTDQALLNGEPIGWDDPLPAAVPQPRPQTYDRGHAWDHIERKPLQLRVHRSIPIRVNDGGLTFPIRTTSETVGEALLAANIELYLGDEVLPSLGSPVSTGQRISIVRSTPVTVDADGETVKTRVKAETVADVLAALEIGLAGMDTVTPPLDTPLHDDLEIAVTRIREDVIVDEEIAPFETIYEADPNLPIDTQTVLAPGAEGITRSRYRVRYEDGEETARTLEDSWTAQQPAQRIIAYGQQIQPQTFTTADGQTITYWRKIRMLATSYSASRAGVSPDNRYYGFTYSGEPMRDGVVAVDFSLIPLRSQVYIPSYGYGDALDTGGAMRGRRIDLGYADDTWVPVRRWVDVYLLWPPPPESGITWVLPNWPRPPQ
jgi:uncharacterized protein YabE (DUF348 family)